MKAISLVGRHGELLHHVSFASLEMSARVYCGICTLLHSHVTELLLTSRDATEYFPILVQCDKSAAQWQSAFEIIFTSGGTAPLRMLYTMEAMDDVPGVSVIYYQFQRLHSFRLTDRLMV